MLPGLHVWYETFWEISTDRQVTMGGPAPLPARSIRDAADEVASPDERGIFRDCMRAMDDAFLAWTQANADKPKVASSPVSGGLIDTLFGGRKQK